MPAGRQLDYVTTKKNPAGEPAGLVTKRTKDGSNGER